MCCIRRSGGGGIPETYFRDCGRERKQSASAGILQGIDRIDDRDMGFEGETGSYGTA
jgi:hypothetical protein